MVDTGIEIEQAGSILDSIAYAESVDRTYYGDDKDNKPNDHCYWDNFAFICGWHETDEHLRERIKMNLNGENNNGRVQKITI